MADGIVLVVTKRCACFERGLPIRVMPGFVAWVRSCPVPPPADLPVESYRCGKCKTTVILTAGDLHFAA